MKTSNTLSILQATAAVVSMAIILWSLGLSSIRFAEAANVTSISDTLSDSAPAVVSKHTLTFTTPTGVANTETITVDLLGNFTGTSTIVAATDITVATTSAYTVGAACGAVDISAVFTGNVLTLTMCAAGAKFIPANGTTTVTIGGVTNKLVNPATGSYEIRVTAGSVDSGATRVAIVDVVTITASVDTLFTFTVGGVAGGQSVNGTTTTGLSTPTAIPFGKLVTGVASTAAQDLTVVTNARNGFVVTVQSDGQLNSATGADIDGFKDGAFNISPVAWAAPLGGIGQENEYGHWGITSDDSDYFAATQTYVSASTTPVQVFTNTGPTDGTVTGQGTTRVGYTVQITPLQEAADDYQAILTYVATPVF
jgi:hypothetical protein